MADNDPLTNEQQYQRAMRAMGYMQSSAFGSHAEVQLAGDQSGARPQRRKSRLDDILEGAVQQVVEGVSRAIEGQPARERVTTPALPEAKRYTGDPVEFLSADQREPVRATDVNAPLDISPASPVIQRTSGELDAGPAPVRAVDSDTESFPKFSAESSGAIEPPPPTLTRPSQDATGREAAEPGMAPFSTSAPEPQGRVRPAFLDAIADQLPERPLGFTRATSGQQPPPRVEYQGDDATVEDYRAQAARPAIDATAEARTVDNAPQEIAERESLYQAADVVSDFTATQGMLLDMIVSHLRGLTEQTHRLTVSMARLTEDSDQ